jgi:sec-independent protein translocase protein TatA
MVLAFFPGGIGYSEMLVIGVVAVLLFGDRLPSVARSMGRSMTEFKKGMSGLKSEWDDAVHSEPQDLIEQEDRESAPENAFAPPPTEVEEGELEQAKPEQSPAEPARGGSA